MRPQLVQWLTNGGHQQLAHLVPTPGLVYSAVLLALVLLFLSRCRQIGLPYQVALEAALAGALGAALGTRIFYLLATGDWSRLPLYRWLDPSRGTASWGVYLGAITGIGLYSWGAELAPWKLLDAGAASAGLGDAIGRWSCWLAGDDFGRVTTVAWAIRFPSGSPPFQAHVAAGLLSPEASSSLPVHPMQFYLMANAWIVFVVTSIIWRKMRQVPGRTFASFLILQGAGRFWWEFFRDPAAGGAESGLSVSQWMCLLAAASGTWLLFRHPNVAAKPAPAV